MENEKPTAKAAKQGASESSWSVTEILAEMERRALAFDREKLRKDYLIPELVGHARDILNDNITYTNAEVKNTLMALVHVVNDYRHADMKAKGFTVPDSAVEDIIEQEPAPRIQEVALRYAGQTLEHLTKEETK